MKKKVFVFVLGMVISMTIYAQTNVYPSSGKVGIGTTSPNASLSIYSDENWNSGWRNNLTLMSNDYPAIKFHSVNSNKLSLIGNNNDGGLYFIVNSTPTSLGSLGMIILPNGKVGIGTNDPKTLFNVFVGSGGTNGTAAIRVGGTNNYESLELGIDGDYDGMIRSFGNNINYYAGHWKVIGNVASENHSHKWFTSKAGSSDWSTVKMVLNHEGNLGIGNQNPEYKLDVIGSVRVYGNSELFGSANKIYGNSDPIHYYIGHYPVSGSDGLDIHWYGGIRLGDGTGNVLQVASGNVGIGTTTPQNKLDVNGTIRAKEVKVETGWADFVFTPTYKLRPLSEVEQFIKTNGHLPEIPKAEDVQQNGVNLGEMQTKLLQKVEELTLYTIELEKKLCEQDVLKAKVEKQVQENAELKKELKELKELITSKLK